MVKVKSVHDGDTFRCSDDLRVRVWGIDTPEVPPAVKVAEPGGFEARDYLRSYISDKTLRCIDKGKSWNRKVGQCFVNFNNQQLDIALPLIIKGFAIEKEKYSKGYYKKFSRNNKNKKQKNPDQ